MFSDIFTSVDLHHAMHFSDDGITFSISIGGLADDEDIADFLLEDHIIDTVQGCKEAGNASHLYNIAHELTRFAEMLRDAAGIIEDSDSAVADLYENRAA